MEQKMIDHNPPPSTETWPAFRTIVIQLVVIPFGLLAAYSLPGPIGSLAALVLAFILKITRRLTKLGFGLVAAGVIVLPVLLFFDANYIHLMFSLCFLFSLASFLSLAASWGRKIATLLALSCFLANYCFMLATSFALQQFQWVPYPSWCERSIVKDYDYRIMQKFFGKALPDSFRIAQVFFRPYAFPAPDGPLPAQYEIHVTAADYQKLVSGIQIKKPEDNERDFYLRRMFSSEKFHNNLFDDYYQSFDDNSHYRPPTVYIKSNAGWFYLDERTSPSLRLFISTSLPYKAEM